MPMIHFLKFYPIIYSMNFITDTDAKKHADKLVSEADEFAKIDNYTDAVKQYKEAIKIYKEILDNSIDFSEISEHEYKIVDKLITSGKLTEKDLREYVERHIYTHCDPTVSEISFDTWIRPEKVETIIDTLLSEGSISKNVSMAGDEVITRYRANVPRSVRKMLKVFSYMFTNPRKLPLGF